jgi:hypothetical protein
MEISGWLLLILFVQVLHGIGTWKLYVKANRKAWEAFVPVYNGIVLMQMINRPKYYCYSFPLSICFCFQLFGLKPYEHLAKNQQLICF